ncbi:MAG: glycosyltransferase [Ruminococcus flavefaciens]|nr:glycosyltransferase [Ruminococcus flavefaciens]
MAIYVFSLFVGTVTSGVDNAQGYRAQMLKEVSQPVFYIFTELPGEKYMKRYRQMGVDESQMLCVHQYLTDHSALKPSVKTADKLTELKKSLHYTDVDYRENEVRLIKDGMILATILFDRDKNDCFSQILYFDNTKLFRAETYTDGIFYADSYVTAKSDNGLYAKLVKRTFYNKDGSAAYDQIFEGGKEFYHFPDGRLCCTKMQLMTEFIKRLQLSEQDTVILDRPSYFDYEQPLFQYGGKARFIAVVHSKHYFEKSEDPYDLYFNKEQYYWFKYSKMIDVMVVSTQEQKEELIQKLRECHCSIPVIEVIPAGGIEQLRYPEKERKRCSLISVSRIDARKKIDWIVRSVIKAHRSNPNISVDIYGDGRYDQLQDLVLENNAQSYVRFMGYRDVAEVYKEYEVYISASLWETLGLSVMEAVGSGTAVIGLDVKYGNHLFIHSEENGYLVDFNTGYVNGDDSQLIDDMAEKIVEIFEDKEKLKKFHQKSYEIGEQFLTHRIREKWIKLLFPEKTKRVITEENMERNQ